MRIARIKAMIIFWVRLFPKRHSRFLLSQLSMAALRAWRKSGQDVLVVGFFTWQPGVCGPLPPPLFRRWNHPGLLRQAWTHGALPGWSVSASSRPPHWSTYLIHPTQVPPGIQTATNHCLPDAFAPPTPRKSRPHLGDDREESKMVWWVAGLVFIIGIVNGSADDGPGDPSFKWVVHIPLYT